MAASVQLKKNTGRESQGVVASRKVTLIEREFPRSLDRKRTTKCVAPYSLRLTPSAFSPLWGYAKDRKIEYAG
jgi:hypothetical protein